MSRIGSRGGWLPYRLMDGRALVRVAAATDAWETPSKGTFSRRAPAGAPGERSDDIHTPASSFRRPHDLRIRDRRPGPAARRADPAPAAAPARRRAAPDGRGRGPATGRKDR